MGPPSFDYGLLGGRIEETALGQWFLSTRFQGQNVPARVGVLKSVGLQGSSLGVKPTKLDDALMIDFERREIMLDEQFQRSFCN